MLCEVDGQTEEALPELAGEPVEVQEMPAVEEVAVEMGEREAAEMYG